MRHIHQQRSAIRSITTPVCARTPQPNGRIASGGRVKLGHIRPYYGSWGVTNASLTLRLTSRVDLVWVCDRRSSPFQTLCREHKTWEVNITYLTLLPVPHFSVAAKSVSDIQAAVKFAAKHSLYLVIKNTGHDQ